MMKNLFETVKVRSTTTTGMLWAGGALSGIFALASVMM